MPVNKNHLLRNDKIMPSGVVSLFLLKINRYMKQIIYSLCFIVTFSSCKNQKASEKNETLSEEPSEENLTTAEAIAYKNGLEKWNSVSEIQFTFNVDRDNNHYERSWIWHPKSNDVTMMSAQDTIQYNRSQMDSITKKTDAAFINDKYWLLAPYNLVWDEGTTFTETKNTIAPISKDTLHQLTVTYSGEGGYTPGDAYDFYYAPDFKIKEWVYRKGNDSVPSMVTSWEDYKNFNGLEIATMHKDSTGNFKLYFTNIEVK